MNLGAVQTGFNESSIGVKTWYFAVGKGNVPAQRMIAHFPSPAPDSFHSS